MARTEVQKYLHRLHELQERTTNRLLDSATFEKLKWTTPEGAGNVTVNDVLRMWTWHFWTHHRDLIMARGRLVNDNPHFHVPHHVREANEAFGRFIGELACLTDEQLNQHVPGGRSIREVLEHVLGSLDGYFDGQAVAAKPNQPS